MKRLCIPSSAILCLILLLAGMSACDKSNDSRGSAAKDNPSPPAVRTATVQAQKVEDVLEIPAKLQPDPSKVVRIYPPAGGRLVRLDVRPGDRVSKGQELAVIESSDISSARSDYVKAHAEAEKNDRALRRAKLLFDHQVLSEREYQEAQANADESKSDLDRAEDRLRVLGVPVQGSSNQVSLRAPRAGVVLDLGAAAGELSKSTDNATPICTMADLTTIWAVGDVYEKDLTDVQLGQSVEISLPAYPAMKWTGKVAALSDTLDPATRTAKVRVVLDNAKRLMKPEMFATIRVNHGSSEQIVVPSTAVLRQGGDTAVMVETKPGSYERRLVTVRGAGPSALIVASGLKTGEIIVVEGAALLRGEQ